MCNVLRTYLLKNQFYVFVEGPKTTIHPPPYILRCGKLLDLHFFCLAQSKSTLDLICNFQQV